jgi:thioredoxin-dependent peroxiredoxin
MPLHPGDDAPDFTLTDQFGEPFSLSASLAARGGPHVVYFYPRADTPGCTQQSCSLRDAMPDLSALGVTVVGISPDTPARQARFDAKHSLGFPLLADVDHAVAEAWGAWGEKTLYGKKSMGIIRSAFVVAPDGTVLAAFPKISPKDTVPKVREALAS